MLLSPQHCWLSTNSLVSMSGSLSLLTVPRCQVDQAQHAGPAGQREFETPKGNTTKTHQNNWDDPWRPLFCSVELLNSGICLALCATRLHWKQWNPKAIPTCPTPPLGVPSWSLPDALQETMVFPSEESTPWLIATSRLHVDEENGMRPTQERQPNLPETSRLVNPFALTWNISIYIKCHPWKSCFSIGTIHLLAPCGHFES
jgi:hypothetical protein